MFITLEDETGIANLVVWVKVFEKYRRIVLGAGMLGVYGRIQREGDVVHLVAHRLTDLSAELVSVGDREAAFPLPHGRGDEFHRVADTRSARASERTAAARVVRAASTAPGRPLMLTPAPRSLERALALTPDYGAYRRLKVRSL